MKKEWKDAKKVRGHCSMVTRRLEDTVLHGDKKVRGHCSMVTRRLEDTVLW